MSEELRCPGNRPCEPWGETFNGSQYNYLNPDESTISIGDIARSLTYQCRYTGHTKRFYSIAEHSIHMALIADTDIAYLALCHDAHEAYCGDVSSPMKAAMRILAGGASNFDMIEHLARRTVDRVLETDLLWTPDRQARVKELDTRICLDERAALKMETDNDWGIDLEPLGIAQTIANFDGSNFDGVESMWLNLFERLRLAAPWPISDRHS
jgi:uncharacterized protein